MGTQRAVVSIESIEHNAVPPRWTYRLELFERSARRLTQGESEKRSSQYFEQVRDVTTRRRARTLPDQYEKRAGDDRWA